MQPDSPILTQVDSARVHLDRILASPSFSRSARISRFLRFVVDMTLEGRADELKETTVAVAVFDREPAYNPKTDPVVRYEARRLRSKLERYYAEDGAKERMRISLPKGGYVPRFEICDTDEATEMNSLEQSAEDVPPQPLSAPEHGRPEAEFTGPAFRRWRIAAAVAVCAIAAGAAVVLLQSRAGVGEGAVFGTAPLTSYPGQEFQASIAPGGKRVAFVWDGGTGEFAVYTKSRDSAPVRLTRGEGQDLHPAWSPDGRFVAFVRVRPSHTALMLVASDGQGEREVKKMYGQAWRPNPAQDAAASAPAPAWSRDGGYLIVGDRTAGEPGFPLYAVPVDGGEPRRLTNPGIGEADLTPAVSPDGRSVAFVRTYSNSATDIFLAQFSGGERRLTNEHRDIRGLAWAPGGNLVFSSNRGGAYALWTVPLAGGQPRLIPSAGTSATEPSVSPEGSWLAYTVSYRNANTWRTSLSEPNAPASRLISSSRQSHSARYSPDGRKLAFVSDRGGSWEVWEAASDGSQPTALTSFRGPMVGTIAWSPDGRQIAFDARPEGHSAIFVISAAGGRPRTLEPGSAESKMPAWSRDGRWIYFNSNRDGFMEIWKAPAEGGTAVQVCRCRAYDLAESSDGQTLYFLDARFSPRKVPASGGAPSAVEGLEGVAVGRMWAVTPEGIYYAEPADALRRIFWYRFSTRSSAAIAIAPKSVLFGTPSLAVSPDRRWLLYAQEDDAQSDLMAVRLPLR
jgi:Tol biopolymer transport system component